MKKTIIFLSSCLAAAPAFAQYTGDYESFSYTSGGNLIGSGSWTDAGTSGAVGGPTIGSDNLSYSGLSTSGGTSAQFGAGTENARFNLSDGGSGTWDGSSPLSIYFSYELQLTSAASTGPFELTALDQKTSGAGAIGSRGGEVMVEDNGSGTGFYLGIMKGGQNGLNNAGNDAGIAWIGGVTGASPVGATLFNYNTTLFVVGSYNFLGTIKTAQDANTDDDTANLWVNPDSSSFGGASAPSGNVTASATSASKYDLSNISSLDLIQNDGSANAAANGGIDDLRIGTTWEDVTPVAAPEPSALAFGVLAVVGFGLERFRRK